MGFKKRSWVSRHFITPHHEMVDLFVRVLVGTLGLILVVVLLVSWLGARRAHVAVTIHAPDIVRLGHTEPFTIDLDNTGVALPQGLAVTVYGSPGLAVTPLGDETYDVQTGILTIPPMPAGAHSRLHIQARVEKPGAYSLFLFVREQGKSKVVTTSAYTTTVAAPSPRVESFARYYSPEGEQLGRGPLPPKVGEITKYQIVMSLPSQAYDWESLLVRARLGPHVRWTGFVPEGADAVHYDRATNTLEWRLKAPRDAWQEAGVVFEIALLPEAEDANTEPVLIEEGTIEAVEMVGKTRYKGHVAPVTTVLSHDPLGQGKGSQVVP